MEKVAGNITFFILCCIQSVLGVASQNAFFVVKVCFNGSFFQVCQILFLFSFNDHGKKLYLTLFPSIRLLVDF